MVAYVNKPLKQNMLLINVRDSGTKILKGSKRRAQTAINLAFGIS